MACGCRGRAHAAAAPRSSGCGRGSTSRAEADARQAARRHAMAGRGGAATWLCRVRTKVCAAWRRGRGHAAALFHLRQRARDRGVQPRGLSAARRGRRAPRVARPPAHRDAARRPALGPGPCAPRGRTMTLYDTALSASHPALSHGHLLRGLHCHAPRRPAYAPARPAHRALEELGAELPGRLQWHEVTPWRAAGEQGQQTVPPCRARAAAPLSCMHSPRPERPLDRPPSAIGCQAPEATFDQLEAVRRSVGAEQSRATMTLSSAA